MIYLLFFWTSLKPIFLMNYLFFFWVLSCTNLKNSQVMTSSTREELVLPSGDQWELEKHVFTSPQ